MLARIWSRFSFLHAARRCRPAIRRYRSPFRLTVMGWRRPKITFAEMRAAGARGPGLLLGLQVRALNSGDRWSYHSRLSDIEPRFTCQARGQRGADVRPTSAGKKRPDARRFPD